MTARKTGTKAGAKISEKHLGNGLRVLLVERHAAPVVAVLLLYGVGSRDEHEHESGLSHFLEHMMFKGTAAYPKGQIDLVTTALGGNNNAFTTYDHTGYWFEFAADRWEQALEIEADRMGGLLLDEDEFRAEKAVVLEELSMGEDDPWRRLSREVQRCLFPRHPYGRPVIGYPDTLEAMDVDDMRDFYRRHYHPGNATLVVCGDIAPRRALESVRLHFGGVPALPEANADHPRRPPLGDLSAQVRLLCHWDDSSRRLCMAWPTATLASDADYALDLLTVLLTTGRLSRLYRRLIQEEGLATSVSASNDMRTDGGAFWIFAECAEGVEPRALEAAIDEEIARLATELVPKRDLNRARQILAASAAHESETVSDLADDLGGWAVDYDWRESLRAEERLARITPSFLRQTAGRYLMPSRRVLGWSLPEGEEDLS
ncbi:MAG: pitrilysin family protein [bacterium]|nr:insulinase family protein [Planctomycetota bacterium]HIL52724.1 insulinase family protein [Planctomycetota bacterium]